MTKNLDMIAKRVAPKVPAWDLFVDGVEFGVLTDFEGEGAVATVRTEVDGERTVYGADIEEALHFARCVYVEGLKADNVAEAGFEKYDAEDAKAEKWAEAFSGAMFAGASQEVAYQAANEAVAGFGA